jgi:glutamate/aspartate transport system ATP-binding protein
MIELQRVSKWYGDFQVLTECSTSIKQGEVVVICGPSGSGKSTLIKTMNALEPFQSGEIIVDGVSLSDPKTNLVQLRARVGMVFQHFELFPHRTVLQNITEAPMLVLKMPKEEAVQLAKQLLDRVGMLAKLDARPESLSGGQKQRVAIARALIKKPKILILFI